MKVARAIVTSSSVLLMLGVGPIAVYSCGGSPPPKASGVEPATPSATPSPSAKATEVVSAASSAPAASSTPPKAQPVVLVSDAKSPELLAVDGQNLYWTDRKNNTLFTAPLAGGPSKPFAANQKGIQEIALDEANVYWTTSDGKGGGSIMKAPIKGGAPTKLVSVPQSSLGGPIGIEVDKTSVYWVVSVDSGSIMKVGKSGGGAVTLASKQRSPYDLAVGANGVYWTNFGSGTSDGTVMMVQAKGGDPKVVADHLKVPWCIAVDAKNAYWVSKGTPGAVVKAPIEGGAATVLAGDLKAPTHLAIDDTHVFWASEDGDSISKVSKEGGAVTILADKEKGPVGIAVDATSVYWTNKADGTVMKIAK